MKESVFKPFSCAVMPAEGTDDTSVSDEKKVADCIRYASIGTFFAGGWFFRAVFPADVESTLGVLFASCGLRSGLSLKLRLQLIQRAVLPILRFRMTRWPFQRYRARWLNLIQRRMISFCLGIRIENGETAEAFVPS